MPSNTDHTEGEWIIDLEANCERDGSKHTECTLCHTIISSLIIPATGIHTAGEWIVDIYPECMADGSRHNECTVCGIVINTETLPAPGYHTESDWIIDSEPTAAEYGSKHIECIKCHSVLMTEEIDKLIAMTISSVSAPRGNRVNVEVIIENNPGIAGAVIKFEYDERLTLVSASAGEAWSDLSLTKPAEFQSPCNFVWDGNGAYGNGIVLTLTFDIPYDAAVDEVYEITAAYADGNIIDTDYNPVDLTIFSGAVTVSPMYGDVNDDGTVDVADVIALRRYLAGGYNVYIDVDLADVNRDGYITIVDVIELRRYILQVAK